MASTAVAASPQGTTSPSKSGHGHHHRDPQQHHVDAQVEEISHDRPLPTLCDVICEEMLPPGGGRQRSRPVLSRILLVGEVVSREDPPRAFFEDVLRTAVATVNAADPLQGKIAGTINEKMNISGICVELPSHFVALLESEPQHLQEAMDELHRRIHVRKAYEGVANLHVAFYADDIISRGGSKWLYVDLSAASSSQAMAPEGKLENILVEQLHKLLAVNRQAQSQPANHVESFLSNLKSSADIPRPAFADRVLKSGLVLSLNEYHTVFSAVPAVTRALEVVHPVEPPLFY